MNNVLAFEIADGPTDRDLLSVSDLAVAQAAAEDLVIRRTAELRAAIDALNAIRDRDLPEALTRAGIGSYTLLDGRKVALADKYIAGKLTSADGLAWIAQRGGAELPKTIVTVELPKDSADEARDIIEMVKARYGNLANKIVAEESIHNATLSSFLNDLASKGTALLPDDLELVGAYRMRRAKVGATRFKEVELKGLVKK